MRRVWKKQKGIVAAGGALIFALVSFGLFGVFQKPARAQQFNPEQYGNVYGFLQSNSVGEISMNCNNDFDGNGTVEAGESKCANGNYGVFIDSSTLLLYGTGWSDAVGIVCFGASCGGTDSPPGPPLGEGTTAQATVTIDANGLGIVSGWARVRNLAPGTDGWMSLKGENPDQSGAAFGVVIDFSSGTGGQWFGSGWNRHADGTGFGWIDFFQVRTTFVPNIRCDMEGAIQPCGSAVGLCTAGTQTCTNGFWGACVGGVLPVAEVCSDTLDNDCDGSVDEGCDGGSCSVPTIQCGEGACAGTQTCANGVWGTCVSDVSPVPELCNGIDDNCNGLTDEGLTNCTFTVTPPQGVYEPLCCPNNGIPSGGQCPTGTQAVFCDGPDSIVGKKLTGTHLNTFEINLSATVPVSGNASCTILAQKPGQCSISTHVDCTADVDCPSSESCTIGSPPTSRVLTTQSIVDNKATLTYTVLPTDPIGQIPWVITGCSMGGKTQTVGAPIFVHENYWSELDKLNYDLYSALDCWYGVRHRYFNNSLRCNLEGDYAFVRSMSRGVPVEGNCTDGVDNDGNGLIDCADRWCKGIAYQCGALPVSGDQSGAGASFPLTLCTGNNVAADAGYAFLNPPAKSVIVCSSQPITSSYAWTICSDATDAQAADELKASLQAKNVSITLATVEQCAAGNGKRIWLINGSNIVPESYVLKIEDDNIYLQGATSAGRYYATQTLKQLVSQYGTNMQFPQIQVSDQPDFTLRGVYDKSFVGNPASFDISAMKTRIDKMASLKMNTVGLAAPMTMEGDNPYIRAAMNASIATLTQYARTRFIEPMFWADYNPLYECKDCVEGMTAQAIKTFDPNGKINPPPLTGTLYLDEDFANGAGNSFTGWETADNCTSSTITRDGTGKSVKLSVNGVCENPPSNNDSDQLSLKKANWPLIKAGETALVSVWTKEATVGGQGVQLRFAKCRANSTEFCDPVDDPLSDTRYSAQTITLPSGTRPWHESQVALPADGTDALLYIFLRKQTDGQTSYEESVWVDDIRVYRFSDAMTNVIQFPTESDRSVRVMNGTTVYNEGQDYTITWTTGALNLSNSLDTNARKFSVTKINDGALADVDTVTVVYDFFAPTQVNEGYTAPHSFSEPKVLSNFERDYNFAANPVQKAFIGMDELRGINRDYRSTSQNLTNGAILAEEIRKRQSKVRLGDTSAKVYVWDDMLNEFHNGGSANYQDSYGGKAGKTSAAVALMPNSVVPIVWNYNSNDWLFKVRLGVDWLKSQGIQDCVLGNGNTTASAQMMSYFGYGKCSGLMAHPWPNASMDEGIENTARYGWTHFPQEESSWGLWPLPTP